MTNCLRNIIVISFFLCIVCCKEKYTAPYNPPSAGFLVVEGVINSEGPTEILLSRSTRLSDKKIQYETGATVHIESEDNTRYSLTEKPNGRYTVDALPLINSKKYRVHIKTRTGREYASAFEAVKYTPPIDTISWKRDASGIEIFVESHDDQRKTTYYKWDYVQTWEFHSVFRTSAQFDVIDASSTPPRISLKPRDSLRFGYDPRLYYCWQEELSRNTLLGSTAKLQKDIIYELLIKIEAASWKLSVLYSVYMKQIALTKEAFEFWERMKKNTEQTGTIFDPQPSELKGNLYALGNPTEFVIGYVIVAPVREKRIWIKNADVPDWGYQMRGCYTVDTMSVLQGYQAGLEPLSFDPIFGNKECVDCRLRGTSTKPGFWP